MDPLTIDPKHLESIHSRLSEKGIHLSLEEVNRVADLIKDELLYGYVNRLITQVEKIIDIDPSLTEREILQSVARTVVENLGAEASSIRIYDPEKKEMISYGSYPDLDEDREEIIPFEDTIAGEVVKTRQSYSVPNILEEEKYKNKEKVAKLGIHSMLAVPIYLHRFSKDVDTQGVLQIYYKEKDKVFTPLEAETAEMFSKRVGYVIALKKINYLHKLNVTKDKILEHIYQKLARGGGIKMKDLFNSVIPELVDIMKIQRCALFSVTEDREHIILEAGYPETGHGIGKTRSVKEELYAKVIVDQTGPFGSFDYEKIFAHYILITNIEKTLLLPPDIKHFLETQQINSVLYIPLGMDETVRYFLVFDAQAHHRQFTEEHIEILTFFGKELTKGLKLEKMDDILHDFKNPAIAVAGFAKRVQKILKEDAYPQNEKVDQALDILLKETSRIQELALTLHEKGKESVIDLTEISKRRFLINEETLKELNRGNIQFIEQNLESPLWIRCFPLHIERVIDNLLNNASNAIPEEGGELSIRSYHKDAWAVVEINNTGQISEGEKDRFTLGEGIGRGLHTCTRLVKNMRGTMSVESKEGQTTFCIMLPLAEPSSEPFSFVNNTNNGCLLSGNSAGE
ncbi:MAG TPA: GAF domain-containing sensor histidine kinase [Thermodesulfobacteriota bacterium]|nr:GAF domain-containing sensor histidine kinase [Thermodesulfobacteriota bacterium]